MSLKLYIETFFFPYYLSIISSISLLKYMKSNAVYIKIIMLSSSDDIQPSTLLSNQSPSE